MELLLLTRPLMPDVYLMRRLAKLPVYVMKVSLRETCALILMPSVTNSLMMLKLERFRDAT